MPAMLLAAIAYFATFGISLLFIIIGLLSVENLKGTTFLYVDIIAFICGVKEIFQLKKAEDI